MKDFVGIKVTMFDDNSGFEVMQDGQSVVLTAKNAYDLSTYLLDHIGIEYKVKNDFEH